MGRVKKIEVAPQAPERFCSLNGLKGMLKDLEEGRDSGLDADDLKDVFKYVIAEISDVEEYRSESEEKDVEIAELQQKVHSHDDELASERREADRRVENAIEDARAEVDAEIKALQEASFEHYERESNKTAIYPGKGTSAGLAYAALGLAGESGEVAEKVKKILRDKNGELDEGSRLAIKKELGDVLWYVNAVASECDLTLADIATANLDKLASRKERGVLGGSGDNR